MAVVSRENMDGHIEPHPIRGARCAGAVYLADRKPEGKIDNVDACRLERVFRQVPVGHSLGNRSALLILREAGRALP
jgi:hypothetical protein